jgi:hypothetical protein
MNLDDGPFSATTELQIPSARSTLALSRLPTASSLLESSLVRAFLMHVPASLTSSMPSKSRLDDADLHNIRAPATRVSTQHWFVSVFCPSFSPFACHAFPATCIYNRSVRLASGLSPEAWSSLVMCRRTR